MFFILSVYFTCLSWLSFVTLTWAFVSTSFVTVRVDTSLPYVSFVSVTNNDFLQAITNINGTAIESNIDPLTYLSLQLSNTGTTVVSAYDVLVTYGNGEWSNILNTATLADGYYDFRIKVSNQAGLYSNAIITNLQLSNRRLTKTHTLFYPVRILLSYLHVYLCPQRVYNTYCKYENHRICPARHSLPLD